MTAARRPRCASLLALLAVTVLAWAGVRSTVMQAAMAAPVSAAACHGMAGMGMAMPAGKPAPGKPTPLKPARCDVCDAAAHLPVAALAARWAPPTGAVAFAGYDAPAAHGPRGPPARRATARGPPLLASA